MVTDRGVAPRRRTGGPARWIGLVYRPGGPAGWIGRCRDRRIGRRRAATG